jgi:hypothetical protein
MRAAARGPGPLSSHLCTPSRGPLRRRIGAAAAVLTFAATLGALAFPASALVPRGDPAARLPQGALAGEYWDLVARFDSGHLLLATLTLTNALGGRTAVAVGHLVEPDGTVHVFSRSENEGGFRLEGGARRIELGSIVLDQSGPERSFVVDKDEIGIAVTFAAAGAPAWPEEEAAPGCPLDVLGVAAPARGSIRLAGRDPLPLRGLAALTHRWMGGLEADCLQRGVELFAMEGDLGVYFREALAPDGRTHAWLLVQRGARTLFQGEPARRDLRWRPGPVAYPELASLAVAAPGLAARVELGEPLGHFEPLARMPAPLRWALELRTRPRLTWSAPRCQIQVAAGRDRLARNAPALVKLSYTNPMSAAASASDSAPAAGEP